MSATLLLCMVTFGLFGGACGFCIAWMVCARRAAIAKATGSAL